MKLLSVASLFFVTLVICVKDTTARSLRSARRSQAPLEKKDVNNFTPPRDDNGKANKTKPRGVFLFDDNCLWYLHGKGRLVAKINCVTPKKRPPVIVAQRRNGKMHYKLHHGGRPWRYTEKRNSTRRRGGRRNQIPLKCFYRYDEKGVFYLTTCYTHSQQFGAVELNFRGHRPGEKAHRGVSKQRPSGGKHWRKRGKNHRLFGRRPHRKGWRHRRRYRRRFRKYRRHKMSKDALKPKRRYFRAHMRRLYDGARKSKASRRKKHSTSKHKKTHKKKKSKKKKGKKDHHKKPQKKRTIVSVIP